MSTTVRKSNYGNYSLDNYGSHTQRIDVGNLSLWFSYDTVIAFRTPRAGFFITENVWGPTTGKHLNWIDPNKKRRLQSEDFGDRLDAALTKHKLLL